MDEKYCTECGRTLDEGVSYCSNCGKQVGSPCRPAKFGRNSLHTHTVTYGNGESSLPLSCMVAYLPGLFFIPLFTGFHDNRHRKCASQGIWLSIITAFAIFLMPYLVQIGNQWNLFDWEHFISLYQNWTSLNWIGNLRALFLYHWLLLPLSLYVPVNSLCGFFRGTHSEIPYSIPLFGRIQLIPLRKEDMHE